MPDDYETQQERDMGDDETQLCVNPNCNRIFRHKAHGDVITSRPAMQRFGA